MVSQPSQAFSGCILCSLIKVPKYSIVIVVICRFLTIFFLRKVKHLISEEMFVLDQILWETAGCLRALCDQPHILFHQHSPVCHQSSLPVSL